MKKLLIAMFLFGLLACGGQKQTEETVGEAASEAMETAVDTASAMADTMAAEAVQE